MRLFTLLSLLCFFASPLAAQQDSLNFPVFDYGEPKEYEIGGLRVEGAFFAEETAILGVTGLKVGDKIKIPGPDIPRAIRNLWRLRLFTNAAIEKEKVIGNVIFLAVRVEERPRLERYSYEGVKQVKHEDLNKEITKFITRGGIVTQDAKVNAAEGVRAYFMEKGYLDAKVSITEIADTIKQNAVRLVFAVEQGDRVKIKDINFIGASEVKDSKLRKQMKETKESRRFLASSKYKKKEFEGDKKAVVAFYNTLGFRDARVLNDSLYRNEKGELIIDIYLEEGNRYYFRNITWKGNSIYDKEALSRVLGIEKGDVYNDELLQTRLQFSQDNRDVSSLYMDNGYLFFNATPIEKAIIGDSIDLEIRISEGPQATIDKVTIAGNDRTHEHVIRRELRTRPGDKFSRSDIIRSQREIINLGYFNQENLGINTPVNPDRGTVDIEYTVEERPSDQLELSAGWGGLRGVIGTLGVTFNNFSLRNLFNKAAWHPLPQGDGQRLSIRAQTNGRFFQSYNASLTEPWLGGKKPTSLTIAGFYNRYNFGSPEAPNSLKIIQASATLGTRLRWPDDNFILRGGINLQTLGLNNWISGGQSFVTDQGERLSVGNFNNFSLSLIIARNTINDPLYPREGSNIEMNMQFTPPYSAFSKDKDYANLPPEDRFRFLEYHKWRFNADWYTTLTGKLVLKTQIKVGILGRYNDEIGTSPFERFQLGGDGINNQQFAFQGVDIISMRGYDIADLPANTNLQTGQQAATPAFTKMTMEVRYPLSLNPSSTIFVLAFAQAGDTWRSTREFNPFDLRRSYGVGARVFLPMFGTLGFDYGIGFDKDPAANPRGNGGFGTFNIILGFEPE